MFSEIVFMAMLLQDKCMDELNSPYGLDFDSTQQLVLASSELFRLSHDLRQRHDGLDDAISKRVRGDTKRNRYDQMKVFCRRAVSLVAVTIRVASMQHSHPVSAWYWYSTQASHGSFLPQNSE